MSDTPSETHAPFRAGLVLLVGRANAGKSTLLNALAGTKVAAVSPRPQTTRDTYHGVVHRPEGQIVLVDSPGILERPTAGGQDLRRKVEEALEGIDVILHVADPSRPIGREDRLVRDLIAPRPEPKVLCLTKCDLEELPAREDWLALKDEYAAAVEVSALQRRNLEALVDALLPLLPEGPPLYPEGRPTNVSRDYWIAEIIREKVYIHTRDEVPYRTRVAVRSVEETTTRDGEPLLRIRAAIQTANDRYRRMLIGEGGRMVRAIGTAARKEFEVAFGRRVYLDLRVEVDKRLGKA